MKCQYPARITSTDQGKYFVCFPDFDGQVFAEGDSVESAMVTATSVLDAFLKNILKKRQAIPVPGNDYEGCFYQIAPLANTQAAILIRLARGSRKLSDLSRALNTSWPSAARLEDPEHWPTLRQLEKTVKALGKRLVLQFEDYVHSSERTASTE